ncbi:MAG: hypothetical protein AB4368_19420 [Xenococcaceae cyanobacterium]
MMQSTKQPPFAIYQTSGAIEVYYRSSPRKYQALICTCHNSQAAVRIATQVALTRQIPVIINR